MLIFHISILVLVSMIQIVFGELCKLDLNCDECDKCTDYTACNFDNIFCKIDDRHSERLDNVYNNLISYIKNNGEINSFCNSRTITLNELEESFTIFESDSNKISGSLDKLYSCEFIILNQYYLNHETDRAKLIIDIKQKSGINRIKFNIIMLYYYKNKDSASYEKIGDEKIRDNKITKILDGLTQIQILINFNKNNEDTILESLIISIETDNPSEKMRIIYIVIIVIISLLVLAIILLIVIYFLLKRKMIRERERARLEEEEKKEKNKKLINNFLNEELKSQLFNDKINLNDCDMCTICCENFVINESVVSVTPCLHVFHSDCIKKWINEQITEPHCPNCKFSFLEYMENPTVIQVQKKKNLNNSNDIKINNINEIKNQGENVSPLSEQMRLNSGTLRFSDNQNNNDNNKSSNEVSIHISDIGDNNNNN